MLDCEKRQKIVKRSENLTILRCINKDCGMHGQEVDEGICSRCPVRDYIKKRPCKGGIRPTPLPERERLPQVHLSDKAVLKEMEATGMEYDLDDDPPPGFPPLGMQILAYKEALSRWIKAGRPTRSQEEVDRIHKDVCTPCEWYDKEKKRCRGCGCKVTTSALAVTNKLKMATEHCPKEKF